MRFYRSSGHEPWGYNSSSSDSDAHGNDVGSSSTSISDICFGKHAAKMTDPFAPQNVLEDPMVSAINPAVGVYITDMVSWRVSQLEKEAKVTPTVTRPYPISVELVPFLSNFRMPKFQMFNGIGTLTNRSPTLCHDAGWS